MRKLVMYNRISADGFFTGPNGIVDWFIHDPEVDRAAHEMMRPDTLLLGRVTYQMFESFWPHVAADPEAPPEALAIAGELNQMAKVVFSQTLNNVEWVNTTLVADDVIGRVKTLKHGQGGDIAVFGSGTIVQQLAGQRLIDEYLIVVTPVVLGKGRTLFEDIYPFHLKLVQTRQFRSGNALLHYETNHRI